MQSKATTVAAYLAQLPEDRRLALQAIRKVVNARIDRRITEGMQYGMIGWSVPHAVYPPGYHCDPKQPLPVVALASQKQHLSIYLSSLYMEPAEQARFVKAWNATGKRLDMGKACIRARRLEDIPLEVVAEAIGRIDAEAFVRQYEASLARSGVKHPGKKGQAGDTKAASPVKSGLKKAGGKKKVAKKSDAKKKVGVNKAGSKKHPSKKATASTSARATARKTGSKKTGSKKPVSKKPVPKKGAPKKAAARSGAR